MRSMTGFSRAAGGNERLRLEVAVRTVNHRHLDITLRVPEELREQERLLRGLVAESLIRGRAEVRIDVQYLSEDRPSFEIEEGAVRALRTTIDRLSAEGLIARDLTFADLLKVPGTVLPPPSATEFGTQEIALLTDTVGRALAGVVAARQSEGGNLRAVLENLGSELGSVVSAVEKIWLSANEDRPTRLRERLEELLQGSAAQLDEARLAQEVAILADRGDVREEVDRLRSHLEHLRELLEIEGEAVGRRLDFLAQEIFRELSTLAAKFREPEAVRRVIDGKLLCEQIREQVQNIE